MRYGIYDTQDKVWIGDSGGPAVFDDPVFARAAAQVAECRLTGTDLGCRMVARAMPDDISKKRDELSTLMSTGEALDQIENG